jgi:hypothetical protein
MSTLQDRRVKNDPKKQRELLTRLEGLLRLPDNQQCADCSSPLPRYASVKLGVFICNGCFGIHRSIGAHVTRVKVVNLDSWLPNEVRGFMGSRRRLSHARNARTARIGFDLLATN